MTKTTMLEEYMYYSLLLYAFVSSISIAASNIAVSLAALLAVGYYFAGKSYTLETNKFLIKAMGIFLLSILISAIFGQKPAVGFDRLLAYSTRMLPFFLTAVFVKSDKRRETAIIVMIISVVISDLYAIWQGLHGNYRAEGFGSHPMILAGYLVQMLPLQCVLLITSAYTKRQKALYSFSILLSLLSLLLNGTRGAWIAAAIVIPLSLICPQWQKGSQQDRKRLIRNSVMILLIGLIAAGGIFSMPVFKERLHTIGDMSYQSNSERVLLWTSAWHMVKDHPLTGVGPGNFEEQYLTKYILPEAKEQLMHAHNNFMNILAENGIVGLAAFTYMFGCFIYAGYLKSKSKDNKWGYIMIFACLGLLIQGLTEFNYGNSAVSRMFWFIMGLSAAANAEQSASEKEDL